jgi:hypothetical protein
MVLANDAKFIDFFNDPQQYPGDYPYSGKFMINFSYILYDKTSFCVKIEAKSCKLTLKKESVIDAKKYILEDSDKEEESAEVLPRHTNEELNPNPEENQNYVDDLDFF